jgi:hypothetical protein
MEGYPSISNIRQLKFVVYERTVPCADSFPSKDLARRFRRSEYGTATRNARFDLSLPVRCRVTRFHVQNQISAVCG